MSPRTFCVLPGGLVVDALRLSGAELLARAQSGPTVLEEMLAEFLRFEGGVRAGEAERRSWRRSLPVVAEDLRAAGLADVQVLLEHQMPRTSKRADVVLAGVHPKTGRSSYVVLELKQWGGAHRRADSDTLFDVDGIPDGPRLHPGLQADGYVEYMRDFTAVLADEPDAIVGAAYLHNASERDVEDLRAPSSGARARLFTGESRGAFHDFLASRLAPAPGVEAADELLGSRVAASKQLLSVAADEIQHREQFVLLDEQREAYEKVLAAVRRADHADTKTVIVVSGGPGSGKSVIALSLVGELARQGRDVMHATGSRSFTLTLRAVAGKGSTRYRKLFAYFNSFMSAERNELDVLVLDEAHRLRRTSVYRFTPAAARTSGRQQIEELVDAARVPVFLLDQYQVVRPGEMGSVAEIEGYARQRGLPVEHVDLTGQFRSGGSERYVDWVLRLLGLRGDGPVPWVPDEPFALEVAQSPAAMEARLRAAMAGGQNARITAGFCWPWSDPRRDGTLVPDVVIGDWQRPWNLRGDRAVGGAPPSALWATADGGFDQVGCVYTAQGFEYSWNGVILGPDLVWRGEGWVARRAYNRDPDFRSTKAVDDEHFDRLVRHVYKVLLTRGLVGTVVYSTDEETQAKLRELVHGS